MIGRVIAMTASAWAIDEATRLHRWLVRNQTNTAQRAAIAECLDRVRTEAEAKGRQASDNAIRDESFQDGIEAAASFVDGLADVATPPSRSTALRQLADRIRVAGRFDDLAENLEPPLDSPSDHLLG
jgi:hypothetical protein